MDGSARQPQWQGQNRHWNLQGCEAHPKARDRRAWHGGNARTRTAPSKQAALHYPITPSADQELVFTGSGEWHNYNLKGAINHLLVVHCLAGAAYSMSTSKATKALTKWATVTNKVQPLGPLHLLSFQPLQSPHLFLTYPAALLSALSPPFGQCSSLHCFKAIRLLTLYASDLSSTGWGWGGIQWDRSCGRLLQHNKKAEKWMEYMGTEEPGDGSVSAGCWLVLGKQGWLARCSLSFYRLQLHHLNFWSLGQCPATPSDPVSGQNRGLFDLWQHTRTLPLSKEALWMAFP